MKKIWVLALALTATSAPMTAQESPQTVLGPGLYVFQTRIDHATCGDGERTGYVSSYFAAVDGIPGSRTMQMNLLNSSYWPSWTLTVSPSNAVIGEARMRGQTGPSAGESRFELTFDRNKFTGQGTRSYDATVNGQRQRCRIGYDALLRKLD
ncbi:MAG: hypothetical protein KF901_11405 [Myxococcales bacterium]|nr:hypothetical protein [Myxococcales bacterium]